MYRDLEAAVYYPLSIRPSVKSISHRQNLRWVMFSNIIVICNIGVYNPR